MNFDFESFYFLPLLKQFVYVVAVLFVVIHVLRARREPASALLWIFLTCIFPLLGLVLYVSFGIDRVTYKAFLKDAADAFFMKRQIRDEHHSGIRSYWNGLSDAIFSGQLHDFDRNPIKLTTDFYRIPSAWRKLLDSVG